MKNGDWKKLVPNGVSIKAILDFWWNFCETEPITSSDLATLLNYFIARYIKSRCRVELEKDFLKDFFSCKQAEYLKADPKLLFNLKGDDVAD